MEYLFTTSLATDEKNHMYKVFFDNEKYNFLPQEGDENFNGFSFKREHDEWHDVGTISTQLRKQALQALEEYLLAQH